MDPVISLRSAVAMVGRFPVLAGVDLEVAQGEIVLLQGANGAGKTSLLRACAGLVRVVAGQAVVLGHDLTVEPRAVRRQVGLLGHNTGLYEDLTALDNVLFSLRASGRFGAGGRSAPPYRTATASAAEDALATLGLTGRLASTPVALLSAGQRRRVALAVLVARRPELWLLDEPHAGLDAENRDLLDVLVRQAVVEGATVVLASHEADRASALAGRVVHLSGGATSGPEPSRLLRMEPGAHVA